MKEGEGWSSNVILKKNVSWLVSSSGLRFEVVLPFLQSKDFTTYNPQIVPGHTSHVLPRHNGSEPLVNLPFLFPSLSSYPFSSSP